MSAIAGHFLFWFMLILLALCFFAFLAGFVDAMVGGGGLIQLPAMFILQPMSLVQTLATNKTANFMGTLVAAARYIKQVDINWKHLLPILLSAFASAFCGAFLVSFVHKEQFMPFIICVLVLVLLYTILKRELGIHRTEKSHTRTRHYIYSISTGMLIGIYDGVIGPGTGSFLIFIFIVVFGHDFLHASAHSKVINCVTNIAALTFFIAKGAVVWGTALPMAAANMLGGYTGSHVAIRKGTKFIRVFFILVVATLIAKLGYDHWLK